MTDRELPRYIEVVFVKAGRYSHVVDREGTDGRTLCGRSLSGASPLAHRSRPCPRCRHRLAMVGLE